MQIILRRNANINVMRDCLLVWLLVLPSVMLLFWRQKAINIMAWRCAWTITHTHTITHNFKLKYKVKGFQNLYVFETQKSFMINQSRIFLSKFRQKYKQICSFFAGFWSIYSVNWCHWELFHLVMYSGIMSLYFDYFLGFTQHGL